MEKQEIMSRFRLELEKEQRQAEEILAKHIQLICDVIEKLTIVIPSLTTHLTSLKAAIEGSTIVTAIELRSYRKLYLLNICSEMTPTAFFLGLNICHPIHGWRRPHFTRRVGATEIAEFLKDPIEKICRRFPSPA